MTLVFQQNIENFIIVYHFLLKIFDQPRQNVTIQKTPV